MMVLKPDKRNGSIWQQFPKAQSQLQPDWYLGCLFKLVHCWDAVWAWLCPAESLQEPLDQPYWTCVDPPQSHCPSLASASNLPMTSDTTAEKVAEWLERGGKAQAKCYIEYSGKGPTHSTFAEHLRVPAGTPTWLPNVSSGQRFCLCF